MELTIDHVSKRFGERKALDNVTWRLTPGVWGLLGANGAGKTTLMRILAGLLRPASGAVLYNGVPISECGERYRSVFGYLPQEFGFYPGFTVGDYLEYVAALKGIPARETSRRIAAVLEQVALSGARGRKIARLSGGMKRRVGIAQAILNEPEVLVLDEPTSGLDPGERVRFRNLLAGLSQGRIVLVATHIVPDVEAVSFQNAILKDGRLLASGTTEELARLAAGRVWSCTVPPEAVPEYESRVQVTGLHGGNGGVTLRYLADRPCDAVSVSEKPCLEDAYLWMCPQSGARGNGGAA